MSPAPYSGSTGAGSAEPPLADVLQRGLEPRRPAAEASVVLQLTHSSMSGSAAPRDTCLSPRFRTQSRDTGIRKVKGDNATRIPCLSDPRSRGTTPRQVRYKGAPSARRLRNTHQPTDHHTPAAVSSPGRGRSDSPRPSGCGRLDLRAPARQIYCSPACRKDAELTARLRADKLHHLVEDGLERQQPDHMMPFWGGGARAATPHGTCCPAYAWPVPQPRSTGVLVPRPPAFPG